MNSIKTPCIICGSAALLMCQRCAEPYCNDDCQRKDWQRHKYFCTVMPPLVTLSPLKSVANVPITPPRQLEMSTETCGVESKPQELAIRAGSRTRNSSNTSSDSVPAGREEPLKSSTAWRDYAKPQGSDFFECRVTSMLQDGSIWVIDVANTERLERLSRNIARCRENMALCGYGDLAVGSLVGITHNQTMYRAQVLALKNNPQGAEVRLIDMGIVCTGLIGDIYFPQPRMAEIKAYAFRVKLPTNTGVQVNKNIKLRFLGRQTPDGVEQVQLKPNMTLLLNLPVQLLAINPDVTVVTTFQNNAGLKEPEMALLQIKVMSNLNDDLNSSLLDKPAHPLTEPFPKVLAARTNDGFRRAILLDFVEKASQYLVYEIDEGRITVTNEVRRIPGELLGHTLRVFAVILDDSKAGSLQKLLDKHGKNLSIRFQMENVEENENKLRTAQAMLMDQNEKVCAVRVNTFLGRISELGHRYWREPVRNGSMVYITHLVDYEELCISSVKTKHYADLFKSLESKCLPFDQSSNVPIGSIVLVMCPGRSYYRAEVTGTEGTRYIVHNIDVGSVHHVSGTYLRKACQFLECLPVSQCRAKIRNICNIPSSAVPPNTVALQLLNKLHDQKCEMKVEFFDADCSILDLLDTSVDPPSLMTRMLPMMFTAAAVELQPAKNMPAAFEAAPEPTNTSNSDQLPALPPSPTSSPVGEGKSIKKNKRVGRFYLDDLKRKPITYGEQSIHIIVLYCIGLQKTGYLTACYFANEKDAESFQNFQNACNDYGNSNTVPPGYVPDVGEVCLTLFAEDGKWYRSVCLDINDQSAHILYIDFGNSEEVPLDRIKPIPNKALYAVYATKCYIAGFDRSKNFALLEKYLAERSKILCFVKKGPEVDTRLIHIPLLDKILNKEIV